jgi:uncharacterized protein (TIGR03546 family)
MGRGFFGPLRQAISLFTGGGSPRAIAFGFALGMMIGLMPKGNLTVAAISILVLATQTNLAAAALSGVAFTWATTWTDPLAHRIGSAILTQPSWQKSFARLYEMPLVPWTGFNNTVVLGSLVLSLVLFYPVYHLAWLTFHRHKARVAQKLQNLPIDKVLAGVEAAAKLQASRSK